MDLEFSDEHLAFQKKVRAFVAEKLPADIRAKVTEGLKLERDDFVRWQDILARQGWLAIGWPVEDGGPGWSAVERFIFEEECSRGGAPSYFVVT